MIMDIVKNVREILAKIKDLELQYNRKIYLVGATKTRTPEQINIAIENGLKIVGENKPQEFRDKYEFISKNAEQHFIGHLQSNKIKYVVGKAKIIHSCDSFSLAEEISRFAVKNEVVQELLIEVNISGEADKHGFSPKELYVVAPLLKKLNNLRFKGVMTVLPNVNEQELTPYCEKMQEIYHRLNDEIFDGDFEFLSMGMSGDYLTAIKHGANMIRLGRAIFGERDYTK